MERTEDDKVTQSGIKVILGGKEFEIRPLVIRYSREWRKKSLPLLASLFQYSRLTSTDDFTEELEKAFTDLFTTKTDEILDSFFEYARELPRDEIEGIATDGEVILAFMEVFNAFVAPLSRTERKTAVTSQSEEPSNT